MAHALHPIDRAMNIRSLGDEQLDIKFLNHNLSVQFKTYHLDIAQLRIIKASVKFAPIWSLKGTDQAKAL